MSISKLITSASLAFAMIGGAIAVTPSSVDAAAKDKGRRLCPHRVGHPCWDRVKPKPPRFAPCKKPGTKCLR